MTTTAPELFDAWARAGRAEGMERGHSVRGEQALQALGVRPGDRCLDLGCGNGWASRWMQRAAGPTGFVAGLDAAPEMIERARGASVGGIDFRQGAFESLPWPEATFDRAFSMEALYYAADLPAALASVASALRPGGSFVLVVDFYAENPHCLSWPADLGIPMQLLGEAGWGEALEAAGLRVERRWRCLDPRPADPGWNAARTASELHFRREVGSLAVLARKD